MYRNKQKKKSRVPESPKSRRNQSVAQPEGADVSLLKDLQQKSEAITHKEVLKKPRLERAEA